MRLRESAVWKKNVRVFQRERIPLQEMLEEISRISQLRRTDTACWRITDNGCLICRNRKRRQSSGYDAEAARSVLVWGRVKTGNPAEAGSKNKEVEGS